MNKDETLALWRLGKDAWNAWAQQMLDRRAEMEKAGEWSASRDVYGTEHAHNDATRGWLDAARADFSEREFEGAANFAGVLFPSAAVFSRAAFKKAAQFDSTTFTGDASFVEATFKRVASFDLATFTGDAGFVNASFHGGARFNQAAFGREAVFEEAKFEQGGAFARSTFRGPADFSGSSFETFAQFLNATFFDVAQFQAATFAGNAEFDQATFKSFSSFTQAKFLSNLHFPAIHVDRAFTLQGAQFSSVPNFIQAHFAEVPRLDNLKISEIKGLWNCRSGRGMQDESTAARYRALRRIAIQAHDHGRELDYFASELKASRGAKRYTIGFMYELFSDFGRSMILPLLWWLASTACFAGTYLYQAADGGRCVYGTSEPWSAAIGLSIRKALPFAGVASANKLDQIYACLYGIHGSAAAGGPLPERFTPIIPDAVDYLGIGQILFSLVLLFLFLLAVRNHFRIK
jgi:Pentapeptide repeats (9 copies)